MSGWRGVVTADAAGGGPKRRVRDVFRLKRSIIVALLIGIACGSLEERVGAQRAGPPSDAPPQRSRAQRFLARRGVAPGQSRAGNSRRANGTAAQEQASTLPAVWTPLGPWAVNSPRYGLVSGRVTSLALDPADRSGNKLYAGTTGGGVWVAPNAATSDSSQIIFTPLTDAVAADSPGTAVDPSISIGAITVQPGGTGVILAGTGDPNDALDSYYGAGILRSADAGSTWTLISMTSDVRSGFGARDFRFTGEAFAGFAWSTANPQLVVAAVSQSAEGQLVNAETPDSSYKGLFYSTDAGLTWHLARITDGAADVQGPLDGYSSNRGSAATSVVWNRVRGLFVAAVRFHGYYQSADGVTWTRMASQPGTRLTKDLCPTNPMIAGSPACPIFRGVLAVNPLSGDTFAWTVDLNNQDQGLWQDVCAVSGGRCQSSIAFNKRWATDDLDVPGGTATVANGDYNLALQAVGSSQDTLLLAGATDLWSCSLAMGCTWRNTTNSLSCMSAQVGPFQHAIGWNEANPLEVFVGNDSGLWRSMDAIGETGAPCSVDDTSHWQNLNGGFGSLAEVESLAAMGQTPYTQLVGLGTNGTAASNSTTEVTHDWPQILSGEGGAVAIDPSNPDNWYVNNGAGVSIHRCPMGAACTPGDFGLSATVGESQVANDGLVMIAPAPFLIDPVDTSQLLIGTCRLWRGAASGAGWAASNVVAPMLDGNKNNPSCRGNALIRSMAAAALPAGGEVVYVGVYGSQDGGGTVAGHVFATRSDVHGNWSGWQDLKLSPVPNDLYPMNFFGLDVSSITIDPHDPTGNTVYVTIAGMQNPRQPIAVVYRTIDGGAHWTVIDGNLPWAPANAVAVDPADANTVYLATDVGVFATRSVATCDDSGAVCWAPYGAGLPMSPVVTLRASPEGVSPGVLVAGTYGRGLWQAPLLTSATPSTSVNANPGSLTFSAQSVGTPSAAQAVTLTNTGGSPLSATITISGDFSETDDCISSPLLAGASCTVRVTFLPTTAGVRSGKVTIAGNLQGGELQVPLAGTGTSSGVVSLTPAKIDFGAAPVGTTSDPQQVTAANRGATTVSITSITVPPPFVLTANSCGTVSLPANSDCVLMLAFHPSSSGPASGTLSLADDAGTQYVQLTGTGTSPPTDSLSVSSLGFPATIIGQNSAAQVVTITNSGMNPLTSIAVTTAGPFLQSNDCGTQLAAQSKCSISVQFQPTAQGIQTGSLNISDILTTQGVALSGTGLLPPVFSADPSSLIFPVQLAGVASAPMTVRVGNAGGAAMANIGYAISGPAAKSFAGVTTCGASLDSGASCTVQIVFTPSTAGAAQATLTLTSSTLGVIPLNVPLNGVGQSPSALNADPPQLTFAPTGLGYTSAPQSVTVSNPGGSIAAGLTLSLGGPFSVAQTTCGTSLPAGASCTVSIAFTPMQEGALTGTLTIDSASMAVATTVALRGTGGLTGDVQLKPATVSFPPTGVGVTSAALPVTLSNISASIPLDQLSITASAGFKIGGGTCGTVLAAGSACTVSVSFAPTASGPQNGVLTIASSVLQANAIAALSGTGFDFKVAPAGSSSQTVASGQTANFSLTLTPSGGVAEAFSFQCSSVPVYATCLFNPSTNNVAAGATGTEMVQITTGPGSGTGMSAPARPSLWPRTMVLACGILLFSGSRRWRNFPARLLLLCFVIAAASSCSSSGGGGGGTTTANPSSHTVAPGTYTIPLP
ncbi:choice-of-anchor D domain-containing protein [Acidobacteria bacterium AB60]|nr:choice-of-anchor D domain-containing protein [Acidobacteria bacterium AB60]